jgi:hypothetical protein
MGTQLRKNVRITNDCNGLLHSCMMVLTCRVAVAVPFTCHTVRFLIPVKVSLSIRPAYSLPLSSSPTPHPALPPHTCRQVLPAGQQRPPHAISPALQHTPATLSTHVCPSTHTVPVPQGVDPAAAHTPDTHVCPVWQHVLPHTTRSVAQQTLFWPQTSPGTHTFVPQGTLPGATHLLVMQVDGLAQQAPPQMGVSSPQQFQPSKQRWPAGQTPVPHRVLPACAKVTPGTAGTAAGRSNIRLDQTHETVTGWTSE